MTARRLLLAGGGTGGHLMPALAIAEAIRSAHPGLEPVLVGAERGIERTLLPTRPFRYHLVHAEPVYRRQWWRNVRWPAIALRLRREVEAVLDAERPAMVIGTGGYASGPVVWAATRRGLPTAIQEQNAFPGLANRWLAGRVGEIWLGAPEARSRLRPGPRTAVIDTGNPIVPPDPARRPAAAARFGFVTGRPVVLVTGGSQGALAINRAVAGWLEVEPEPAVALLWVTGRGTHAEFRRFHRPPYVHVVDFLDPMADGYALADLVVGRAGMLTVAEVCAWGLPSILIPLPTAAADHQTLNARALAASGAALNLPQAELTPERLRDAILGLLGDAGRRERMAAAARARGRPHATAEIVARILRLVEGHAPA